MPNPPNLWQRVWAKLQPDVESWLVDTGRYILLFFGLIVMFAVFRILRSIGINTPFVDILEQIDHTGIGIVFAIFVATLVRRALVSFSRTGR
jgi:hypothetical protein